jgi:hypothetical protein
MCHPAWPYSRFTKNDISAGPVWMMPRRGKLERARQLPSPGPGRTNASMNVRSNRVAPARAVSSTPSDGCVPRPSMKRAARATYSWGARKYGSVCVV